jgi:hypothetical protein
MVVRLAINRLSCAGQDNSFYKVKKIGMGEAKWQIYFISKSKGPQKAAKSAAYVCWKTKLNENTLTHIFSNL